MSEAPGGPRWALLHAAVKGRNKKYSQDSSDARLILGGSGALLTVADGHGSRAHHRSDLGSRWAVEAFTACALALAEDIRRRGGDEAHWPAVLAGARGLPQQIVHHWWSRMALHEANSPAAGSRAPEGRPVAPDPVPYGSTLVGVLVVGRLLLCWQLGDGDVVLVDETGEPSLPFYDGPELGDEVDSLCQEEAWRQMRVHWERLPPGRHTGVLVSTDGLSKSFADHAGFVSFAAGLRDRARDAGLGRVREHLPDWLTQAASYSGDDSTLVGAFPAARYEEAPAGPAGTGTSGDGTDTGDGGPAGPRGSEDAHDMAGPRGTRGTEGRTT